MLNQTDTTCRGKPLRRISRRIIGADVATKFIGMPQPLAARRGKTNGPPPSSFKSSFPSQDSSSHTISRPSSRGSFSSRLERTHSDGEVRSQLLLYAHSINLSPLFRRPRQIEPFCIVCQEVSRSISQKYSRIMATCW